MNLFYRKLGTGSPLFILHGLFGSSDNWQSIGKRLAESREVYLIDLRNHGQSFHSEQWSYSDMAMDLLQLMKSLNLQKASIIGHSMGGKVAMKFTMQYPEMVEKLIVVDIGPKYYPIHHHQILDALNGLNLSTITSRKEAEIQLSQKINSPGELQFLLKNLYWKNPQNNELDWRFNLPVITKNIEIVGEKQNAEQNPVKVPTLFLRGEKSNYILDEDFEAIKKSFAAANFETIEGAGHWVQAEKPELFYEQVVRFI